MKIITLIILGLFFWGLNHDGKLEELSDRRLKDLTFNDLLLIGFGLSLIFGIVKILSEVI